MFYTVKGVCCGLVATCVLYRKRSLLWSGGHVCFFYILIIEVTCGNICLLIIHNSNKYILIELSCQMLNGTAVQITVAAVL